MKHRPQLPDEHVNVSRSSPLAELLRLGSAVVLIGALVFLLTGVLVDAVVSRLPDDTGAGLQPQVEAAFLRQLGGELGGPRAATVRRIFATLLEGAGLDVDGYRLLVIDNELVNALAGPANVVALLDGLLDEVRSENELAMVLAHELGHAQHKDPIRALGRGVILSGLAALVFGRSDALNSRILLTPTHAMQQGYSRRRELAADRFALALVCRVYGHSGGTQDFFARHSDDATPPAFFTTHPSSAKRIERLRQMAGELNCPDGDVLPLAAG